MPLINITFVRIEESLAVHPIAQRTRGGHQRRLSKKWNLRGKPKFGIKGFRHCAADIFEGRMMCVHWRIQAAVGIGRQAVFVLTVVTLLLIWAQDISKLSHGIHCASETFCLIIVFVSF